MEYREAPRRARIKTGRKSGRSHPGRNKQNVRTSASRRSEGSAHRPNGTPPGLPHFDNRDESVRSKTSEEPHKRPNDVSPDG
jgi:hypothetical protein